MLAPGGGTQTLLGSRWADRHSLEQRSGLTDGCWQVLPSHGRGLDGCPTSGDTAGTGTGCTLPRLCVSISTRSVSISKRRGKLHSTTRGRGTTTAR